MNELEIIEYGNQRVLTTQQLAESFGTDTKTLNRNYQRNESRYEPGKHYHALTGNDLREFKGSRQNDVSLKYASVLYLWTEKGAWLHAKSLNTDKAWDAYEMLVDEYYLMKEEMQAQPLEIALQAALQHEREIKTIKTDVNMLKNSMRIDGAQEHELRTLGKQKVLKALGGYQSTAYKELSKKLFSRFWRDFNNHFKLPRYSELPKSKYEEALHFIEVWRPDTSTQIEINIFNSQLWMGGM